jgi:hypothetical protein
LYDAAGELLNRLGRPPIGDCDRDYFPGGVTIAMPLVNVRRAVDAVIAVVLDLSSPNLPYFAAFPGK